MKSLCSVQRYGGTYDGSSANGWFVVVRPGGGDLEAVAGPFQQLDQGLEQAERAGLTVGGINTELHKSRALARSAYPSSALAFGCRYCQARPNEPCKEVT